MPRNGRAAIRSPHFASAVDRQAPYCSLRGAESTQDRAAFICQTVFRAIIAVRNADGFNQALCAQRFEMRAGLCDACRRMQQDQQCGEFVRAQQTRHDRDLLQSVLLSAPARHARLRRMQGRRKSNEFKRVAILPERVGSQATRCCEVVSSGYDRARCSTCPPISGQSMEISRGCSIWLKRLLKLSGLKRLSDAEYSRCNAS
jgi:hypothetical protein